MTWSPLACGIVSGKYDGGIPPYSRASLKVSAMERYAVRGSRGSSEPPTHLFPPQGYQWLKDKILSEEGRRQQAKLKELQAIAERLGCTLPQLAIGKGVGGRWGAAAGRRSARHSASPAWCLRNEGVSSVLLGASNADQLMENIGAIQVRRAAARPRGAATRCG